MASNPPGSAASVWVVETGEYTMRGVWGVYSSPEAAVASLKATYAPPYIVVWEDDLRLDGDTFTLTGHFEYVPGKSVRHVGVYDGTRYEVDSVA